jgi:hypothetical protein
MHRERCPERLKAQSGGRGGGNMREFLGLGPPPDAAVAARGAFCHGEKASGAGGPNLVRSVAVLHDEKGERMGAMMSNGPSAYMLNGSQYLLAGAGDTLFAFKLVGERK